MFLLELELRKVPDRHDGVLGHASSGTTRLKLWAFRTLKNTISNVLSGRFTHSFSLVTPVGWALPTDYV
jgi:hypothetical protein